MTANKRINADHRVKGFVVGGELFILGDKEIAVKIRGNSHYRNSCFLQVKSECISFYIT